MRLSKAKVAVAASVVVVVLGGVVGAGVWTAVAAEQERKAASVPLPVPTFAQPVPSEAAPPAVTGAPGGTDATSFGDASAVPGAYAVGDFWFIDCDSAYAAPNPQFPQHGCEIVGFEQQLGTLVPPEDLLRQEPASAADQETARAFVAAWIAYDSTGDQAARDARLAELAPGASLPEVPELGWETNQDAFADLGYRAEVRLQSGPSVTSSAVREDGTSSVTVTAGYLGLYTLPIDCPWGEVSDSDELCALGNYQGDAAWTVHLRDGAVTAIYEPDIIRP